MDYFNLKYHNTTIKKEILAGISLYIEMAYILVVCPSILSSIGMDYNGVFFATVVVTGAVTIMSGFCTKLPFALAPGLAAMCAFVNFATGPKQIPWQTLLLATYFSGIAVCGFVRFGLYDKMLHFMDSQFRKVIVSGIGFATLLYGLYSIGLLGKENGYYVIGRINPVAIVICVLSLLIIYVLKYFRVRGYLIIGLVMACFISIGGTYFDTYQVTGISIKEYLKEIFAVAYSFDGINDVMLVFPNIIELFSDRQSIFTFINAVFVFSMIHFFDAVGTIMTSWDKFDKDTDIRVKQIQRIKRAVSVNGVGSIFSGIFGISSVTTYAESTLGIISKGKTGITAIVTGCIFLISFFASPLFTSLSTYVAGPVLVYVGLELALSFKDFDKSNKSLFVLGLCIIAYIGFTFDVCRAVIYGMLLYFLLNRITRKEKPAPGWWIMLIFAGIHIILSLLA